MRTGHMATPCALFAFQGGVVGTDPPTKKLFKHVKSEVEQQRIRDLPLFGDKRGQLRGQRVIQAGP